MSQFPMVPPDRSRSPSAWFRLAVLAGGLLAVGAHPAAAGKYLDGKRFPIVTDGVFTADEYILEQARFWYAIYAEVGDDEGLIHDPFYPDLVFCKVKAPGAGRASARAAEAHVKALQSEIQAMVSKDSSAWTPRERELKSVFPSFWDSTGIMLSADRLRFQRGLKGKYRAGLERSYRYLPMIDSILAEHGVPARLKYLPHVESSFFPFAYSKVGAAGMWQFMKSSARHFKLKVGYQVDQRRDPHASTQAAARMLAGNFAYLQSWPLAIVAYNHGPGGLARAVKQSGTRDLGTIIKSYYSNSFGFASKNFYAEFLAASSIAMKADSLYPDLRKLEPLRFTSVILPKALGSRYLCSLTGLSPEELEEYNLSLRPAIFRGKGRLPKGFPLRLPMTAEMGIVVAKLGGKETAPVAVARAETRAMPSGASAATDSPPAATLPISAAQDKVENRMADAGASPQPEGKPLGKRERKRAEAKAASEARADAAEPPSIRAPGTHIAAAGAGSAPPVLPAPPEGSIGPGKGSGKRTVMIAATEPAAKARTAAEPPPVPQSATVKRIAAARESVAAESRIAAAGPSAPEEEEERVVDPALSLQAADMDKLAHPMDRFDASIYNLDYAYKGGNLIIRVGADETLSHYAEWAGVSESALRRLNRIRHARDFRLGRKIRIPVAEGKAAEFISSREENYRAVEEDFYGNYYVSVIEPFRVEKGMNLWNWAQEREIPFWLLQKHNRGRALNEMHPGDTLNLPVIENGSRRWGFTRYGNSREYLSGISRYLMSGKPEAY